MIPRILKINNVSGHHIHCVFNTGEYRVIDLAKFAARYNLSDNQDLTKLLSGDTVNCELQEGTLVFPDIQKHLSLSGGQQFVVAYDLDPVMLYDVSEPDTQLEQHYQVGKILRRARKNAGLTQEELARRVGTSKGYISRIENDRTDIALKTLRRIVEVGLNKRLAIVD